MPKVIHLIPYDGIGGVESAARTMAEAVDARVDFNLRYLFPAVRSRQQRAGTFNLWRFVSCTRELLREQPDLLIVSLWRSAIVGILVRLLRPRTRLVVFIHNSVDAHLLDYLVTRFAMRLAHEVWLDSQGSAQGRFSRTLPVPVRQISFLARDIRADAEVRPVMPTFVFWGRLSAQKNLCRAMDLFARVHAVCPQATFQIIGPEGDETARIREHMAALGLGAAIHYAGPRSLSEILAEGRRACFYLQTSRYEGMAMSVVEAMQLGLVPVVTPVGEIAAYCRKGENAILVEDDDQAVAEILGLLASQSQYDRLRAAAIRSWQDKPLYRESVLTACQLALA